MSLPLCPACEARDHFNSALCEKDYRCGCPCHGHNHPKVAAGDVIALSALPQTDSKEMPNAAFRLPRLTQKATCAA